MIVDDDVDGAANAVTVEATHLQRFVDDALAGKKLRPRESEPAPLGFELYPPPSPDAHGWTEHDRLTASRCDGLQASSTLTVRSS